MGVNVQCRTGLGMAQQAGYRAHVHALGNQQAGVRMTKLVEATNGHSLMEAEKAISLVT